MSDPYIIGGAIVVLLGTVFGTIALLAERRKPAPPSTHSKDGA